MGRDWDRQEHEPMPFLFSRPLNPCVVPLLECVRGMSGEGSQSSPVISAGLKLLGVDFWQFLNLLRGLPCFRFPEASSPNISCFGSLLFSMRICVQPSEVDLLGSWLRCWLTQPCQGPVGLKHSPAIWCSGWSAGCTLWKRSSCFRYLLYRVHVSQL